MELFAGEAKSTEFYWKIVPAAKLGRFLISTCLSALTLSLSLAAFAADPSASSSPAADSKTGAAAADKTTDTGAADASAGNASAGSASNASAGSGSDASGSGQTLQAGAQMIELNLQMLRDLGLDIKNILKASSSLYDEVTIQPVSLITEPEIVGMGTIIQIPVGTRPVGPPAQPKKQRVDFAMNQMRPIIEMLKKDHDEFEEGKRRLDIDEKEHQDLQPLFDKWKARIEHMSAALVELENVTKGPPYENGAIAQQATAIHEDAKAMDEIRRKVYKYIQKHGKKGNA